MFFLPLLVVPVLHQHDRETRNLWATGWSDDPPGKGWANHRAMCSAFRNDKLWLVSFPYFVQSKRSSKNSSANNLPVFHKVDEQLCVDFHVVFPCEKKNTGVFNSVALTGRGKNNHKLNRQDQTPHKMFAFSKSHKDVCSDLLFQNIQFCGSYRPGKK